MVQNARSSCCGRVCRRLRAVRFSRCAGSRACGGGRDHLRAGRGRAGPGRDSRGLVSDTAGRGEHKHQQHYRCGATGRGPDGGRAGGVPVSELRTSPAGGHRADSAPIVQRAARPRVATAAALARPAGPGRTQAGPAWKRQAQPAEQQARRAERQARRARLARTRN